MLWKSSFDPSTSQGTRNSKRSPFGNKGSASMAEKMGCTGSIERTREPRRKPYDRPKLQAFGALQRLTKGTGGTNGDGGQGLMPSMP
jgi:hypothetical protein